MTRNCNVRRLPSGGMRKQISLAPPAMARRQGTKRVPRFLEFMGRVIERLDMLGKAGTCRNYRMALKSFGKFCCCVYGAGYVDCSFCDITADLIERYEAWLAANGVTPNTISFYMRILRAVYRRAVEKDLALDANPFARAYTGIERTVKRAIPLTDIRRIKNLDLSHRPSLERARDIFMFLFYCRGMSFVDAANLRMANIYGGTSDSPIMTGCAIVYRRQKTNQELTVGINSHIRAILLRYHVNGSSFLLPIIKDRRGDCRRQYEAGLRRVNNALKKIAELAGISATLTTYVSRHAWASIAKSKGIPVSTISDALGHDSVLTTQIYLSSISSEVIDRANDLILADL